MAAHDPAAVRALAERLIAISSVSPDPTGEARCAKAVLEALPAGIESGTWPTRDGRPVVWVRVRGRSRRTLILLGHFDTVGYHEYASLGAPAHDLIALDPAALRERIVSEGAGSDSGTRIERDIAEEWRRPGTWMFGRGALDMKSGLAAGLAALERLASESGALGGDVMMIAAPDEEHLSAGMNTALESLPRDLELHGVLNLDYVDAPVAYRGAMGKSRFGVWVLGRPGHAGAPFEAVDAMQIAADLALRATLSPALADRLEDRFGPPPVALRLRDLKWGYDVQTAGQAELELNVVGFGRPRDETLGRLRVLALTSVREVLRRRDALRGEIAPGAPAPESREPMVLRYDELEKQVTWGIEDVMAAALRPPAQSAFFDQDWVAKIRDTARRAKLAGPAVVIEEVPPSYPAVAPADGPLSRATARVLGAEGLEVRTYYPFITDASLVATRAWGAVERAPDIVTLGPWGRDAHGLFERVHAPYAFEKLPRLIAEVAKAALLE